MTTSPEAALLTALAIYLRSKLASEPLLIDSEVVDEWPDPTVDLQLSGTRVVIAVVRAGRAEPVDRLGGPNIERVTPGVLPAATLRYEMGEISQGITLGLYACRARLRDDVDRLIAEWVNQPMWSTIEPVASTTLAGAITRPGEQLVTVANLADIWPGATLEVNADGLRERVVVKDIRPTGFIASFSRAHAAGVTVVEVAGRRELAASDLHLRAADHFSARAHYSFDEGVQTLDDAEGGAGSQRQEWRSLRAGVGRIHWTREVAGTVQTKLDIAVHASAAGGTVASPVVTTIFE